MRCPWRATVPSNGASQKAMLAANAATDDDALTASPPLFWQSEEADALLLARTGSAEVPSNGASQKAMLAAKASSIAASDACGKFFLLDLGAAA
jgi:hypothetical protein